MRGPPRTTRKTPRPFDTPCPKKTASLPPFTPPCHPTASPSRPPSCVSRSTPACTLGPPTSKCSPNSRHSRTASVSSLRTTCKSPHSEGRPRRCTSPVTVQHSKDRAPHAPYRDTVSPSRLPLEPSVPRPASAPSTRHLDGKRWRDNEWKALPKSSVVWLRPNEKITRFNARRRKARANSPVSPKNDVVCKEIR